MTTYAVFTPKQRHPVFYFAANFSYRSNPLLVLGDEDQDGEATTQATPYKSADAGNDPQEAARLLAEWLASETGENHGAADAGLHAARITYEVEQWVTTHPRHDEYRTVDDGVFDTEDEARAMVRELRSGPEWADLRIVARNRAFQGSLEVLDAWDDIPTDEEGQE